MTFNRRLYILGKVGVDRSGRFRRQQSDALRDGSARRGGRMDHGYRMIAVLDHDLRTRADPGQQSGEVAGSLRFRDVDYMVGHQAIISSSTYEKGLFQHRSHPFAKSDREEWGTRPAVPLV